MTKRIFGEKIEMTQVFDQTGAPLPVTLVKILTATVLGRHPGKRANAEKLLVGFGKRAKCSKTARGLFKELGSFRYVRENRVAVAKQWVRGDRFGLTSFKVGEMVKVRSQSKGKGFQGVVKRHHFAGSPASHGHRHDLRKAGSIGCRFPQHVLKGRRMAGHMGARQATVANLRVVDVIPTESLIVLKGSIPGSRHALVQIEGEGELAKETPAEIKKNKKTATISPAVKKKPTK